MHGSVAEVAGCRSMTQGERHELVRSVRGPQILVASGGALTGVCVALAGMTEGPPLQDQWAFWLSVVFGALTVFAMLYAVADSVTRARREEQREVASSQERLERAEGHLVNALNVQARSSLFDDAFLDELRNLPSQGSNNQHHDPVPAGDVADRDITEPPQQVTGDASLLTLSALWETTHARLKLYHDVALGQANRSFRSAQRAMWIGFVALAGFVTVALMATTTAGSIVAGSLGVVAAGLAGFIGRTFVRSQETAAEHLRSYFDQPLELSRYLAAERLVADARLSPEQRTEILTTLVTAMVSVPQPSADTRGQSAASGSQQG